MPQRSERVEKKSIVNLLFFAAALSLLGALVRRDKSELVEGTSRARKKNARVAPRRIAATLAFATLFFAGAALSAGAGDKVASLIDPSSSSSAVAGDTTDTTTTDEAAPDAGPTANDDGSTPGQSDAQPPASDPPASSETPPVSSDSQPSLQGGSQGSQPPAPPAQPPAPPTQPQAPPTQPQAPGVRPQASSSGGAEGTAAKSAVRHRVRSRIARSRHAGKRYGAPSKAFLRQPPLLKPTKAVRTRLDREPEADEPNIAATIWLHRALPDPTPPSRRLKPAFARQLVRISARNHVDWALALAVLRASGERGSVPAGTTKLNTLAKQLAYHRASRDAWTRVLALEGRTGFADRTIALRNLYRAVGLKALVKGFDWAKPSLAKRVLEDKRITIYPGGRADIEAGKIDIRVLVLIAYLAEAHGQVTVSCLLSGHRLYARPGVVSAHIYGLAADISSVGGTTIYGHQQPGGITEKAVRNILMLPAEMQPRQVISLLGLGGPSFPLSNHDDHIHVGY